MKLFFTVFLATLFMTGICGCSLFQGGAPGPENEGMAKAEESTTEESFSSEGTEQESSLSKEDRVNKYLSEMSGEASVTRQKNAFLIDEYLQSARKLMKEGKFNAAEGTVMKALSLDEQHPQALNLFYEIERILGRRIEGAEAVRKILADRSLLRIEAQKLKAEEAVARGKDSLGLGKYANAISSFEEALNIINWNPYLKQQAHFDALKTEAADLLANAKTAKDERDTADEESKAQKAYEMLQEEEKAALEREMNKVNSLIEEAVDRFAQREYEKSEEIANKILEFQPFNANAKALVRDSRQAQHQKVEEDYLSARRNHYRNWSLAIKEVSTPYADVLTWPDKKYWDKITKIRKRSSLGELSSEKNEQLNAMKGILKGQKINLEFEDIPFKEVIDYVKTISGVNIIITPEVADEMESNDINVTLKLNEVSVECALDLLMDYGSVDEENAIAYVFRDNVILITKKANAMGTPVVILHDINDLVNTLVDFSGPKLELPIGDEEDAEAGTIFGAAGETKTIHTSEDLLDLVRQNIAPNTWEMEGFSIDTTGGNLLAVTTIEIHKEVENFLNNLRRHIGSIVTIEARFITIQQDFLQDIGVNFLGLGGQTGTLANLDDVTNGLWDMAGAGYDNQGMGLPANKNGNPSSGLFFDQGEQQVRARTENIFDSPLGGRLSSQGGLSLQWTFLGDAELSMVLKAVEKSNKATILTSPTLTASNTQRASVTVINQISYIKDFDVEVAQTAFIADPVVGIIQDGYALDVRPTISNDRKYVTLEIQPTIATVLKPIPTFATSLSGLTTPVTMQLPELRISRAQTTIKVPDGGSVLIGGLKRIRQVDRKSGTPFFSDIPILGFFFTRKGKSEEIEDLIIVVTVHITDLEEETASRF